ncbi:MAG: 3'-5' exonuclease [Desulfovibrio sp.]|nr:3'-5' exonuclease [Desulfovibrio sp.]
MSEAFAAIDFETSGRASHFACSVGIARVEDGEIVSRFYRLIRPPSSYVMFSWCHGLYWHDLKDKPSFAEIWPEIEEFIDGVQFLIAHNARFDRRVLHGCREYFGVTGAETPFLDTLKGARRTLRLPSYSLDAVCDYFNIPLNHHSADSDADGCASIFLELRKLGCPIEDMLI